MPNDTVAAIAAARAKENEWNMRDQLQFTPDQAPQLAPAYKVYIFNLMPMEWKVEKGSAGTFTIKGCEYGAPYSNPLELPSVVIDSYFIESEMKTHSVSGEFMAQDIVHPTIGATWSFGQNLDELGVFWTRNKVPTEAEIGKARTRMEVTFRKLLSMATSIETSGKLDEITPLMRIAATYFGEDRAWNRIYKKMAECPGCGEPVKAGIIKHHCGFVFDPDRALLSTMITPEQYKLIMEELAKKEHASKSERGKTAK
jgi:hypothetical protein